MPFSIVRDDIAHVCAGALVNAANSHLAPGGGVCGAIYEAAGYEDMLGACRAVGPCEVGGAVVTPAFKLHARYVIHAVGPVWRGGGHGERTQLRNAYRSIFKRTLELKVSSVAFPLISAGIYGCPPAESLELATTAAREFLAGSPDVEVILVVFDRAAFALSLAGYRDLEERIDDAYVAQRPVRAAYELDESWQVAALFSAEATDVGAGAVPDLTTYAGPAVGEGTPISKREVRDLLTSLDASFSDTVLALIDERGLTDAEVYKRANLSRQLFSKIRHGMGYKPTKQTAVALAMALELSLDETDMLLERAGFALSHASKFDVIVEYFIEHRCYDVFELNQMLFAFDQPLVGSF